MELEEKQAKIRALFVNGFYPYSKVVSGELLITHGIQLTEICRKPFNGGLLFRYDDRNKWLGPTKPLTWGGNTGWNVTEDCKYALCRVNYDDYINFEIEFNDMNNLPILSFQPSTSTDTFISFWSKFYSYSLENLYYDNIDKDFFESNNLIDLFIWKNGMVLSSSKQKSLEENILVKLDLINEYKTKPDFKIDSFLKDFSNIKTAVWKIFLLHTINPNRFPIYDQHIHRASLYILNKPLISKALVELKNSEKESYYFQTYLPLIEQLKITDLKKLDEAFFTFGQFLNSKYLKEI